MIEYQSLVYPSFIARPRSRINDSQEHVDEAEIINFIFIQDTHVTEVFMKMRSGWDFISISTEANSNA